ncbi:MAG: hypothetical protein DRP42_02270 [Tenericutes bacterium]|nr:MAG: hypothetical protein DRP42_02270 [Mycoplasmatota bacterium]
MKASKVFVDESLIQDRSIFVDRVIGFKCFEKDFDLGIVKDYFQQGKNYSLILDLNGYIYNIPAVDEFIESIDEDKKIVLFKRGKELIINEN